MNGCTELYLRSLMDANKLCQEYGFRLRKCSGVDGLEELMQDPTLTAAVALDLTTDGSVYQVSGGGFFEVRVNTIFLLHKYEYGRMSSLDTSVELCRTLFRQFLSRMIVDSKDVGSPMCYLNTQSVQFRELEPELSNHLTGLYFHLQFEEPYNLVYEEAAWRV